MVLNCFRLPCAPGCSASSRDGALPGGSAGITLAQEQQETLRVLLYCLCELSPQLGSDRRYLYCYVPLYHFCSLGLGLWKKSKGVGF